MNERTTPASRAVQFSAFDALKGFDALIAENLKIKEARRELSEDVIAAISEELGKIQKGATVKVTYYKDFCYRTAEGTVTAIDPVFSYLMIGKEKILFSDLSAVAILGENE